MASSRLGPPTPKPPLPNTTPETLRQFYIDVFLLCGVKEDDGELERLLQKLPRKYYFLKPWIESDFSYFLGKYGYPMWYSLHPELVVSFFF